MNVRKGYKTNLTHGRRNLAQHPHTQFTLQLRMMQEINAHLIIQSINTIIISGIKRIIMPSIFHTNTVMSTVLALILFLQEQQYFLSSSLGRSICKAEASNTSSGEVGTLGQKQNLKVNP